MEGRAEFFVILPSWEYSRTLSCTYVYLSLASFPGLDILTSCALREGRYASEARDLNQTRVT